MDEQLFQPLLSTTAISSTSSASLNTINTDHHEDSVNFVSNSSFTLRLLTIFFVGIIAVWANYEAAKGFDIVVMNEVKDSLAGKRFALLYVSNDEALRIIQKSCSLVESVFHHTSQYNKKYIRRVTLRLTDTNRTGSDSVIVEEANRKDEFVINLSPSIMLGDFDNGVKSSILHGMARIWLWNGESRAPPWVLDGLVEYVKMVAGFGGGGGARELTGFGNFCSGDKDPIAVAQFLYHCEKHRKGFIEQLNQGLKVGWNDDRTAENALGIPVQNLCNYTTKLNQNTVMLLSDR